MKDPTYIRAEIDANPVWKRAFYLSELRNDNAPIGWSDYIAEAKKELEEENGPGDSAEEHGLI